MVAQFPAHKPVNFASLTYNFIVTFSKSFGETLILNANTANKNSFPGAKSYRGSLQINLWRAKAVSLSELPKLPKIVFVKS